MLMLSFGVITIMLMGQWPCNYATSSAILVVTFNLVGNREWLSIQSCPSTLPQTTAVKNTQCTPAVEESTLERIERIEVWVDSQSVAPSNGKA